MGLFQRRDRLPGADVSRLEERHRALARATREWISLLREMENNGESGGPTYERYYRAYVEAKQQEKQVDLELFNLRRGLLG